MKFQHIRLLPAVVLPLLALVALTGLHAEADERYYVLPDLIVRPLVFPSAIVEPLGRELGLQPTIKESASYESVAVALEDLVGVSMHRRGPNTLEPNIRGLTKDRVPTYFNGVYLPNASPTRTGAPVNFFAPGMLEEISLSRFFPSVTLGPSSTGARLDLKSFEKHSSGLSEGWRGGTALVVDENRSGFHAHAHAAGDFEKGDLRFGGQHANLGDYSAGDGRSVDADYEGWGGAVAVRYEPSRKHRFDLATAYFHQDLIRNNSLPLDTKDTDFYVLALEHTYYGGAALWRARLGYTETMPYLTSEDRPITNPALRMIEAESTARSLTMGASVFVELNKQLTLEVGADYTGQERDATRFRHLNIGKTFEDPIWPDVHYSDAGLFIESVWEPEAPLRARLGGRIDYVWSGARRADVAVNIPGTAPGTVREKYQIYSGTDAADTDRTDFGGAVKFVIERTGDADWLPYAGIGVTHAPAGVGERYRAFLNALGGGVELGNPALKNETKWEAGLGFVRDGESFKLHGEFYYAYFQNFIQRQQVDSYLNGSTGMTDPLFSYRNIDASFAGFEISSVFAPEWLSRHGLSVSSSIATVFTREHTNHSRLPEAPPPWELRGSLLWEHAMGKRTVWAELSGLAVAARDNPQPLIDPIFRDTAAYMLWDLRLGLRSESAWSLEIAIENLLDQEYYEYLQPPVAAGPVLPSGGDLEPGDSIPGPGRSISLRINWRY